MSMCINLTAMYLVLRTYYSMPFSLHMRKSGKIIANSDKKLEKLTLNSVLLTIGLLQYFISTLPICYLL